jgi:ribonuclease HI
MSNQVQNPQEEDSYGITIYQQNINKSLLGQHDLLFNLGRNKYDICAIQEPYIDHNGSTRANPNWITVYPSTHQAYPDATRSLILINTFIFTNNWKQIHIDHPDITAIEYSTNAAKLRIFNIYNDCDNNNALMYLNQYLDNNRPRRSLLQPTRDIWVGDFNRHHPIWDEPRNEHLFNRSNLDKAQTLINLISKHSMAMALPPFIPTLKSHSTGNLTRVDNVFCSEDLIDTIIECRTNITNRPIKSDHFPIITKLNIAPTRFKPVPKLNFKDVDWDELSTNIKQNLATLPKPTPINNIQDFTNRLQNFNKAIWDAINNHVEETKPSPYSKRWWNPDLTKQKRRTAALGRKSHKFHEYSAHPVHEQYRTQRNKYANDIKEAKTKHWKDWLEGLNNTSVWQATKFISGPPTDSAKTRIPTLKIKNPVTKSIIKEASTNKEKGDLFYETFFPVTRPRQDNRPTEEDPHYPEPKWKFKNITNDQIARAIDRMKHNKATKHDTIPNSVFKHAKEYIIPHIGPLFRATFSLKYYPPEWAITDTLILKKPAKTDYSSPSAWRPIVLSNGLARLLNMCLASDMVTMCETHGILPPNHFGARPGRTTTDSIHLLIKTVKDAWRNKAVASALFLDVKGAFPSVNIDKLIHNMRKRGIPKEYTDWLKKRLGARKTILLFDDFQTDLFQVLNGLDQGDPFSVILYLLYNSDLTDITLRGKGENILLFVDDAAIIVTGKNFTENHEKLKNIMTRDNGVLNWATSHNCEFNIEKFQLLDFSKKLIPHPFLIKKRIPAPRNTLKLNNHKIESKDTAKFLGVILDNKLNWKSQGASAIAKGQDWLIKFKRVAKTTGGIHPKLFRQIYTSIALPRILYAADLFLTPQRLAGRLFEDNNSKSIAIKKLISTQRKAAILITGALSTTATDAANTLANLLPIPQLIEKIRYNSAIRMASLPNTHPLHKAIGNAAKRLVKRHPTPLHDLFHRYNINPSNQEQIRATRFDTHWKPIITTRVTTNADRAKEKAANDNTEYQIFTDGSGMDNKIGASAVLYKNKIMINHLRHCLGDIKQHTVFEGEVVGALLASKLIEKHRGINYVTIYADNRALIAAITSQKPTPGHYLMDDIHNIVATLKKNRPNLRITLKWVPAHKGVIGNEKADIEAKNAITEGGSHIRDLPPILTKNLKYSRSASKQEFNAKIKEIIQQLWTQSPRYPHMKLTSPSPMSNKHIDLITKMPRKYASIITQLKTGHIPLAKYLYRIGKTDSPICPACRQESETIIHFLIHCPAYHTQRQKLRYETGGRNIDITSLLTKPKPMKALIGFIKQTRRWRSIQPLDEEEIEQDQRPHPTAPDTHPT